MTQLNKDLKEFSTEVNLNQGDKQELAFISQKVNDLRTQYFNIQEYIEKNTKVEQQATATGDVNVLTETSE